MDAYPDGTLVDENGQEYYSLFWEGNNKDDFHFKEGFIVEGKNTAIFLEKTLKKLGLNRREANEFIIYWLPQMENNNYNLIHFSTQEYEEEARLFIDPNPDKIIRIMMVWSPLKKKINIPIQNLESINEKREGFTVVEWGGKKQYFNNFIYLNK